MSLFRVLLIAAAAAAPAPLGCHHPRARMEIARLPGTHPEQAVLRCLASDFPSPPHYTWHLPPGVRAGGVMEPLDQDALLVQLNEASKSADEVECVAAGEGGAPAVSARLALGPTAVTVAKESAGILTVEGAGFPAHRDDDDGVWLVPARGWAVRADSACKAAAWGETRIAVCVPKLSKRSYQVRVQSGGRLALGPSLILGAP